ncbi:hypothetical protein AARAC_000631 [Aspergillus arachidicola]|uniref:MFS transporter n=1 Tax=Aspergillus arachidicola TaxID=656916 RepID=A0A2G7FYS3_9EURO|nr:hypothetical protein AARAC_000631 [Aspergillus arachidicola]
MNEEDRKSPSRLSKDIQTWHEESINPQDLTHEERIIENPLWTLTGRLNRNNYASARLQGLETDLGLRRDQYEIGLSVMYISYILTQVPSNLLLNYFGRPSLYLGFFVLSWGLVATLTSQYTSFGGIVACRFMLGLVEAPFMSGVLFYLSKWYKKDELNLRMAIFYSGSLISGAFGNLIAAGILNGLSGKRGKRYVPAQGAQLAVTDIKTWILAFTYMAITGAAGFQNFFPTLTATLGYSHIISLLLVAPPYIFMKVWSYVHGALSDRLEKRFWFFMYPIPLTVAGFIIFMTVDEFGPKYFSFFLVIFVFAMNSTLFTWIATSIPRPPTKRAGAIAITNSLGNSASIWTPFTYSSTETPYYRTTFGISAGLQIIAAGLALWLRFLLVRENKLLASLEDENVVLPEPEMDKLHQLAIVEGVDIDTARQLRRGFRYVI